MQKAPAPRGARASAFSPLLHAIEITLRNRISHREPIVALPLATLHREATETLAWMSRDAATAVHAFDDVPRLLAAGSLPLVARMEALLLQPAERLAGAAP